VTREQRLTMADAANTRAAAVGALWADIARTHAAIAATLPETEPTDG
jgi:hypothetical protein